MQAALGVVGFIALLCVITFLPETMHPGTRGIDKAKLERVLDIEKRGGGVVLLNPFKALALMKSPVLLLTVSSSLFLFGRWDTKNG